MPKFGGIEFIYARHYSPPDVPTPDYKLEDFFTHVKTSMRHPKVIVELVPVNITRTLSKIYIEALFYFPNGDQVVTSSMTISETHLDEVFEKLSEVLKERFGK